MLIRKKQICSGLFLTESRRLTSLDLLFNYYTLLPVGVAFQGSESTAFWELLSLLLSFIYLSQRFLLFSV